MRLQIIRPILFLLPCIFAGALIDISPMSALAQQSVAPTPASTAPASPAPAPGELEALVAPIALYPDQLLAKIMIASTYPLEIVEAARWQQQNKTMTGSALDSALASQTWDDSVKDLVRVPEVLEMMDKQISWTQKLGDAFLGNQAEMLKAVQRLRAKAKTEGNLKDTEQQKVVTENQTIIIQPSEPEKVYVPYYNPQTVYGSWGYASYPPYYMPPPYGYAYGAGLAFLGGMAIGAAFWGNGCNWGGGNVYVNRNTSFNNFNNRTNNIRNGQNWQHNANHRKGVGYGNSQLNNRYGRGTSAGANGRRDFRGFDNNGLGNRGGVGDRGGIGGRGGVGDRGGLGGGSSNFGGNRGGVGGGSSNFGGGRGGGNFSNSSFSNRGGGFDNVGRGSQTRSFSNRGGSSMSSARSSGYRGGGGGGGGRGGGGRGGGGGRRR